jgi:hypothetical protein
VIGSLIQQLLSHPPDRSSENPSIAPIYFRDVDELLFKRDFAEPGPVRAVEVPGGPLPSRIRAWQRIGRGDTAGHDRELVFYRRRARIGTSGSVSGQPATFVSAERYHRLRLGQLHMVVSAYTALQKDAGMSFSMKARLDRVIFAAYWREYLGLLLPPDALDAIARAAAEEGGDRFLEYLETMRRQILSPDVSFPEAVEWRKHARIGLLRLGAQGKLTDLQASVGEFFSDLLLLERGSMALVLLAETERHEGTPRWEAIGRLLQEPGPDDEVGMAMSAVLRPHPIQERIPEEFFPLIEVHTHFRTRHFRQGVFTGSPDART